MTKRKAILCIDDEPIILDSLKEQIEKSFGSNLIYETAENADEGLEILAELQENDIDVLIIVSDWLMPGKRVMNFWLKHMPNTLKLYPYYLRDMPPKRQLISSWVALPVWKRVDTRVQSSLPVTRGVLTCCRF